MYLIRFPVSEIHTLMVNPDTARINDACTHMAAIIEDQLVVIVGDFKGIEDSDDLNEILKRNLGL